MKTRILYSLLFCVLRLDLKRVGLSGHSFGGYTTLAVAGQTFITALGETKLADPRVISKAMVLRRPGSSKVATRNCW